MRPYDLAEQKTGERPKQQLNIPRAAFNKLVDWYMKEQPSKKPTAP